MNYQTYISTIRRMLEVQENASDGAFEGMIPRMIEYAELRIYRDLDLLTQTGSAITALTLGSRNVTIPGSILIVSAANLITPASAVTADAGTRNPLERVSLDLLNAIWPTTATTGTPSKYALLSDTAVRLAPTPSATFTVEFIGLVRPALLAPSVTTTTFISTNLPDLLIAASMIFGTGYQQNFGAQSGNPQMGQSWEAQYAALLAGANREELRRKGMGIAA